MAASRQVSARPRASPRINLLTSPRGERTAPFFGAAVRDIIQREHRSRDSETLGSVSVAQPRNSELRNSLIAPASLGAESGPSLDAKRWRRPLRSGRGAFRPDHTFSVRFVAQDKEHRLEACATALSLKMDRSLLRDLAQVRWQAGDADSTARIAHRRGRYILNRSRERRR